MATESTSPTSQLTSAAISQMYLQADVFSCAICQKTYNVPKVLPCLHSFCQLCLQNYLPDQSLILICPVCRQQSILPPDGVLSLQTNDVLIKLMEVVQALPPKTTQPCLEPDASTINSEEDTGLTGDDSQFLCPRHSGQTLKFYCNDCEVAACSSCTDIEHRDHHFLRLPAAAEEQKIALVHLLDRAKAQVGLLGTALKQVVTVQSSLVDQHVQAQQGIESTMDLIARSVHQRRHVLLRELQDTADAKQTSHTQQLMHYQNWYEELETLCQVTSQGLDVCSAMQTLLLKKQVTERLTWLATTKIPSLITTSEVLKFHAQGLEDLLDTLQSLGTVQSSGVAPWLCEAKGEVLDAQRTLVNHVCRIVVILRDAQGKILSDTSDVSVRLILRCHEHPHWLSKTCSAQPSVVSSKPNSRDSPEPTLQHALVSMPDVCSPAILPSLESHLNHLGVESPKSLETPTSDQESSLPPLIATPGNLLSVKTSGSQPESPRSPVNENVREQRLARLNLSSSLAPAAKKSVTLFSPKTGFSPCPIHPDSELNSSYSLKELCASTPTLPKVAYLGEGRYEVLFLLPQEGNYDVSILVAGRNIRYSPFKVRACNEEGSRDDLSLGTFSRSSSFRRSGSLRNRPISRLSSNSMSSKRVRTPVQDDLIMRIGMRGRGRGEFTNPQGVCCAPNGKIIAADSNNQCIQIFSSTGECKIRFGERGRAVGQLQRPTGVAVLPNGNYVVADYENRWVSVFEANGKFVSRIGTGKLLGPKGVAVDQQGRILVVDNKASCVYIFQSNGRLVGKFGSRGSMVDHLAGPHFVAVNSLGQAVVSDFHNHSVKVFDGNGKYLYSFGTNGEGNGQFNAPTGIAVDSHDNILVADWGNSRIQVFDRAGFFLQYVNTAADPLYGPQGLTLSPDGHIIVADSGNHCLKVYRYQPPLAAASLRF